MKFFLTMVSMGKPIILETEPDQEFLGFMIETKPLEVIYQGPTNISQVLSPFSASPPACSSEWLSLTLSYCHQGCVSSLSCSTRLDPVNSFVLPSWVSQGGTPDNFRPTLDSASELSHRSAKQRLYLHDHVLRSGSFFLSSLCCVGFLLFFLVFLFWFSFRSLFFFAPSASCPVVPLSPLFLLAVSWLNLRSLLPSRGTLPLMDHAQASRFPSPFGSGSDAFELFGGAPSLFRALH